MAGRGRGLFLGVAAAEVKAPGIEETEESPAAISQIRPAPEIGISRAPPLAGPPRMASPRAEAPRMAPPPMTRPVRMTHCENGDDILVPESRAVTMLPGFGRGRGIMGTGLGQEIRPGLMLPVANGDSVKNGWVAAPKRAPSPSESSSQNGPQLDSQVNGAEVPIPAAVGLKSSEQDVNEHDEKVVRHAAKLRAALNGLVNGVNTTIQESEFLPVSKPGPSAGALLQQVNKVTITPQVKATERSPKIDAVLAEKTLAPLAGELVLECGDDLEDPGSKPVKQQKLTSMMQEVVLVNVEGLDSFYIKPPAAKTGKLVTVELNMNKWYGEYAHAIPAPTSLTDLVKHGHYAAYIPEQRAWRRAIVRGWTHSGQVRVQLLDDGGAHVIHLENLRLLRRIFCKLPGQAFHARLDVTESHAQFTPAEIAAFKDDVKGRKFLAGILSHGFDADFAPFRTVGIALLQLDHPPKLYTFGGRIKFAYHFGEDADEAQNAQN